MDWASVFYLGTTLLLLLIFALIVVRTCNRRHRDKGEAPKYRMLDDD
ncbi:MAG: CcoQ/FixQ family Cbb3-type cytochrome c oxidase assembly chaperone [Deltaproteobacteria bacterium]|nr:MAG: CcoQ/FixQ family Cbb3-type cytochrome c oxidase assembly chaperone [Deltaproteobacteria bacterium]